MIQDIFCMVHSNPHTVLVLLKYIQHNMYWVAAPRFDDIWLFTLIAFIENCSKATATFNVIQSVFLAI